MGTHSLTCTGTMLASSGDMLSSPGPRALLTYVLLLPNVFGQQKIRLQMPRISSNGTEQCVCTSVLLDPLKEYNIVGFEPVADMDTVNHMSVVAGETFEFRDGGETIKRQESPEMNSVNNKVGEVFDSEARTCSTAVGSAADHSQELGPHTLFIWGRNAGPLVLPDGVAFKAGRYTRLTRIVLQIHYKKNVEKEDDQSGVIIHYTEIHQSKTAGIKSIHAGGLVLPSSKAYLEAGCPLTGRQDLHPLFFLVHTHSLGTWASLWAVTGKGRERWDVIGRDDPQRPQEWRRVENDAALQHGDVLMGRCTMESRRNSVTLTGPTREEEMCAVYMLYWVEGRDRLASLGYCMGGHPRI